jgi:hypothetical protein
MEGKIMKKIGVVLILGMILLIPAYSVAETPVLDNGTDNFEFARLRWDFRDYGNLGTNWIGGSRLRTGAFFVFECEILTGGHLQNIEDVTKVVALNTLSNRQYILHYDPFYFGDYLVQYWLLLAQADDSMFAPWKFILHYNGSDGKEHQQIQTVLPPEKAFPAEISEIAVNQIQGYTEVSWRGIGEPVGETYYQVLVLDKTGLDVFEAYSIGYYGFYNPETNRAIFYIPPKYGGKNYSLRLANGISANRSLYYIILKDYDN